MGSNYLASDTNLTGDTMKKYLLLICLFLIACQPLQQTARDSIAVAKGVIETAQQEYLETCRAGSTQPACEIITDAVAAHNLVIDVLNIYCAGDDTWQEGAACTPNSAVGPRLRETLSRLNVIIANVKELIK